MQQVRFPRPLDAFAEKVGVNVWTLYKIEKGKRATEHQAVQIHHGSCGAVPCWVLRPDLWREGQVPPLPLPEAS